MKGRKGLKRLGFLMALLMALVVMAGCGSDTKPQAKEEIWQKTDLTAEQKVDSLLESMSDEEKVGQLILFGMQGTQVTTMCAIC